MIKWIVVKKIPNNIKSQCNTNSQQQQFYQCDTNQKSNQTLIQTKLNKHMILLLFRQFWYVKINDN